MQCLQSQSRKVGSQISDSDKPEFESLKALAERAGLNLDEDDVAKLLSGFESNRAAAAKVRGLISPELEPASVFQPSNEKETHDGSTRH